MINQFWDTSFGAKTLTPKLHDSNGTQSPDTIAANANLTIHLDPDGKDKILVLSSLTPSAEIEVQLMIGTVAQNGKFKLANTANVEVPFRLDLPVEGISKVNIYTSGTETILQFMILKANPATT